MKKRNENCFLRYWPWLLPVGLAVAVVGRLLGYYQVLPDFWMGFAEGCGAFLALLGAAFLITRIVNRRKEKSK